MDGLLGEVFEAGSGEVGEGASSKAPGAYIGDAEENGGVIEELVGLYTEPEETAAGTREEREAGERDNRDGEERG